MKNISPVIIPGSKIMHTEKVFGAGIERPLFDEEGMEHGTLNSIFRPDELRKRIAAACNVILVPQSNPGTERFHKISSSEIDNPRYTGNKTYIMASGIFTFNGGKEIMGGDSGVFLTLDKVSHDRHKNSIIEPVDNVKEQFIQIADLNMDFHAARDLQTAQEPVKTQLIHIFEENEIRGSGKTDQDKFLEVLKMIEASKSRDELKKLLKDNEAIIKNFSPLLHSKISGASGKNLESLTLDKIKNKCRAIVIK